MTAPEKDKKEDKKEDEGSPQWMHCRWLLRVLPLVYGMSMNGAIYGYTSPSLMSLQCPGNNGSLGAHGDFCATPAEASWVVSLSSLGYPLGTLLSGPAADTLGRSHSASLLQCGTYVASHMVIYLARHVNWLYAGRLMAGICQGFCNCLLYVYAYELCGLSGQRALVGAMLSVAGYSSTLLTYVIGIFLTWRDLALSLLFLCLPYVAALASGLVPESPFYLARRNDKGSRERAIEVCRNLGWDEEASARLVSEYCHKQREDTHSRPRLFQKPSTKLFRGFVASLTLMAFYQFAGYGVVSYYATVIISHRAVGHNVDDSPDQDALVASSLVAAAGLAGVLVGLFLVQRCQRKTLLLLSAVGTATAFATLAVFYQFLEDNAKDSLLVSIGIPTLCLAAHILLFSFGYGSVAFTVMAELLPEDSRSFAMSLVTSLGGLFSFASAKSFGDLGSAAGPATTFAVYSGVNLAGAAFVALLL